MSNRVTRDGDTVTVRCQYHSDDAVLRVWPGEHGFVAQLCIPSHCAALSMDRSNLAALGAELLALAGEPDWKALALKLGLVIEVAREIEQTVQIRRDDGGEVNLDWYVLPRSIIRDLREALNAITDAEWAALEGVQDE